MSEEILNVKGLRKKYKAKEVLKDVNLNIYKGEILGLIGKNGAGKTTFLKCINGLIHPSGGTIKIEENAHVSSLIEEPGLVPYLSASQNLSLLYRLRGKVATKEKIEELLNSVNLENNRVKVKDFSLGMKQRLGIAMTLVDNPDIVLLDEPTNGLDPDGIMLFRELILKFSKQGITFIISSHALDELSKISSRAAFMNDGKIVYEGENKGDLEKLFIKYIMGR